MPVVILLPHSAPANSRKEQRMIRHLTTVLVLSAFALGALAQNSPPGGGQQVATPRSIENKASLATADDPNSIRGLVDEVFNLPRAFPRMPASIEGTVKDRLAQSEISYRQGRKPGVQEKDVVDALNNLSEKLGGPPHSKTTLSQVRVLRMWLALSEPKFMGTGLARQDGAIGESISPTMGPLQAAHLIATLIDQKFMNPDFQVTPQEWEGGSLQKVTEKIQAAQARVAAARATGQPTAEVTSRIYSTEKRRELEQSLYPNISALSTADSLNLIQQTLAKLHID